MFLFLLFQLHSSVQASSALLCSVRFYKVQFSSFAVWVVGNGGGNWGGGGHERRFSTDSLPVFSAGGHREQFWHRQGRPLFDVVHVTFRLSTTGSPTLQRALEDGFGDPVVACNMLEPFEFLFLDSYRKKFLWACRKIHLAPHPVVGLVLQVGSAEKFSQAFGLESLDPFSQSQQAGKLNEDRKIIGF